MSGEIICVSPDFLAQHLDEFLAIDRHTPGEPWNEKHFKMDAPLKWSISRAVLSQGVVIGFLMASQKGESFHIHRLVVDEKSKGQGAGSFLVRDLELQARDRGIKTISLKVLHTNSAAIEFYLKLNFLTVSREGDNYSMKLNLL